MEVVHIGNPNLVPDRSEDADSADDEARRGNVTLFRIHPQYTLQSQHGTARTELTLGALIERSSDTDLSAQRSLPSVGVLWESSSPTGVLGLRASLAEASTRETEFAEFGRVALDSTQRTGAVGATWARELSLTSGMELAVNHARVRYDTPLLRDYNETGASAQYRWQQHANRRYSLTVNTAQLRREGELIGEDERNRISRNGIQLGYEADLSEGLTLGAHLGAVRTGSPDSRTRSVGGLRLAHEGERLAYAFEWGRDVSADGTPRGYSRADTISALITYPFSVNTSLSVGASHARSLDGARDQGTTAFARIRSDLTPFWAFTAGVEHRRARSGESPSAQGHSVSLGLVYTHPDF
ncbi:MAG: hypothetical protein C0453_04175 [Comamonadaceae bacterium]|nr:hypothetical protein [Comamonadaceae bacterium]